MSPETIVPRTNRPQDKGVPGQMGHSTNWPRTDGPSTNGPRTNVPAQMGSRQKGPHKFSPEKALREENMKSTVTTYDR